MNRLLVAGALAFVLACNKDGGTTGTTTSKGGADPDGLDKEEAALEKPWLATMSGADFMGKMESWGRREKYEGASGWEPKADKKGSGYTILMKRTGSDAQLITIDYMTAASRKDADAMKTKFWNHDKGVDAVWGGKNVVVLTCLRAAGKPCSSSEVEAATRAYADL